MSTDDAATIDLEEFVQMVRTPENADEIDQFADIIRDGFPDQILTLDDWHGEVRAWRLLAGIAPAIMRAVEHGATRHADGTVTVQLDAATTLDLLLGPDAIPQ